jgi:hypothetical protein
MAARSIPGLKDKDKDEVRRFWDRDPCGTRYLEGKNEFEAHARARYQVSRIFGISRSFLPPQASGCWRSVSGWEPIISNG